MDTIEEIRSRYARRTDGIIERANAARQLAYDGVDDEVLLAGALEEIRKRERAELDAASATQDRELLEARVWRGTLNREPRERFVMVPGSLKFIRGD